MTWMEAQGYNPAKRYTQEEVDAMVEKSPYYKATSNDVDWLMKVKMQGRIQKWVDHSISVTINLPNDVDEDLVNRLYVEAWKSGCKGCTVYRDGSRSACSSLPRVTRSPNFPPCKPPRSFETRPQNIGCRRCPLPEQQGEMGGIRRLAGQSSLRNIHRCAG